MSKTVANMFKVLALPWTGQLQRGIEGRQIIRNANYVRFKLCACRTPIDVDSGTIAAMHPRLAKVHKAVPRS